MGCLPLAVKWSHCVHLLQMKIFYKHLNSIKYLVLYNALKWVTAVWWQMNIPVSNPLHLLCFANGTAQPGTLSDRWHMNAAKITDFSLLKQILVRQYSHWGQYLKSLSAEQTYLATALARSIFLCGTLCCRVLWISKHIYGKPALESPGTMSYAVRPEQNGNKCSCSLQLKAFYPFFVSQRFIPSCLFCAGVGTSLPKLWTESNW